MDVQTADSDHRRDGYRAPRWFPLRPPPEVSTLQNDHLGLSSDCVSRERGLVTTSPRAKGQPAENQLPPAAHSQGRLLRAAASLSRLGLKIPHEMKLMFRHR